MQDYLLDDATRDGPRRLKEGRGRRFPRGELESGTSEEEEAELEHQLRIFNEESG